MIFKGILGVFMLGSVSDFFPLLLRATVRVVERLVLFVHPKGR